jgi:EmrB/QacA subfamily drug resistance transporter
MSPPLSKVFLAGIAGGAMLVPLNSTMLAVALPAIMVEFGLDPARVTSIVALYLGAVAITLPVGGSLADRFGPGRMFLVGILGFGFASLLAATTGSFLVLELARVLQAVAGALVTTSASALIRAAAPASRRGEAFGLFELLVTTSAMAGPLLGGMVVAAFGWRATFLLALPIALGSAALVRLLLTRRDDLSRSDRDRSGEPHASPSLDVVGLVLLGLTILAFLVALRGGVPGSSPASVVALLAIVPLLAIFVLVELRHVRPAVDIRLLRRPPFAAAIAGVFGATVVLHGSTILVPLLVERLLNQSPITSGLALLAVAGLGAVVAPIAGRVSDRSGRRIVVVTGSLVMTGGLVALAQPFALASVAVVALLLAVTGLGMGIAGAPRHAAALETADPDRAGMAAATYYTSRYLGGVVGATLAGAIIGTTLTFGSVAAGFGLLAVVALLVAVVSIGMPASPARLLIRPGVRHQGQDSTLRPS